jgi:hypothetical protein
MVNEYRRLKAVWSREAQEDLRTMHNLRAEGILTEILAQEINAEIDADTIRWAQRNGAVELNRPSEREWWDHYWAIHGDLDDEQTYYEHRSESCNWQKEGF